MTPTTDDRPTLYRVEVSGMALAAMGCPPDHTFQSAVDNAASCRGCSISVDADAAIKAGEMTLRELNDWSGRRIFSGSTSGPFGRRTLSRIIAFAHQHPDPVFLKGWFDGPQ